MNFEKNKFERFGKIIGYTFMYLIFTTLLYLLLKLLHKLPQNWNYINILLITLAITLLGTLIKFYLK